jgi:acetyltransferase-like isoleucine patch superfamily enzyme
MGSMAHSYRDAGTIESWDTTVQPSPILRRGCVVGQDALIVGGIEIGYGSYVAAGEIVRHDIPAEHVFYKGCLSQILDWRGVLRARVFSE